jgi:hypothetical protein
VGLIARVLEEHGIPTVCVVMNRQITENVKTPRALFVHFPYGAPLGPAGHPETQEAVIRAALDLLHSVTRPGTIVEADIEWPE